LVAQNAVVKWWISSASEELGGVLEIAAENLVATADQCGGVFVGRVWGTCPDVLASTRRATGA
jgi:hypothetical protein